MTYAVIMAGGVGSRFWPSSRQAHPKQFLDVFGGGSLLQATIGRLQGLIDPEHCLVVTHKRYVEATRDQLPAVPRENILAEPVGRNTAPCIAYAAAHLLARDPDATMIVLPADHVIRNVSTFHDVLHVAIEKAQDPGALVTIGIEPTHPETGYGYIQFDVSGDGMADSPHAYPVKTFAEKPDIATAERFLDSGDFLWNSGMFIWRADTILEEIERHIPELHRCFLPVIAHAETPQEEEAVKEAYDRAPKISIDYGVMEKAERVFVVPASFGWSDVGDWRAVYDLAEKNNLGNAVMGNVILHDSSRCFVQAKDRLVVVVGIHDAIIVDTEDAVLVCNRDSSQQVKNVVDYMNAHQLTEYV